MWICLIFFVQLVHGLNIYIDPNNEIRALKPLWISTGFSPERAKTHERQSNDLLKKETLLNLQLIGSLPRGAIEQVRVHWLLDLMEGPLEMGHLDDFIHALWKSNLRPGFELMGNPGNKFFSNFSGAEILCCLFIIMAASSFTYINKSVKFVWVSPTLNLLSTLSPYFCRILGYTQVHR
mgnify:CR=1 FL=1